MSRPIVRGDIFPSKVMTHSKMLTNFHFLRSCPNLNWIDFTLSTAAVLAANETRSLITF
jgi:hypothetical protein